jgi:hypothetical protein
MIAYGNVSYLAHFHMIGRNALTCLGVRVQGIGLWADETQETAHIFDVSELFATDICSNELNRTSRISSLSLAHRTPHHRCAVDKDNEAGDAIFLISDSKGGIRVANHGETRCNGQDDWRNVKVRFHISAMRQEVSGKKMGRCRKRVESVIGRSDGDKRNDVVIRA